MDLKTRLDASIALSFLREHPAFCNQGGDSICNGLWFMMMPCCKHGISEDAGKRGITVYQGDVNFSKFNDLLVEQWDEADLSHPSDILHVEVPYERMYGEPWSYDHMEYWYELTFFVFRGDPWDKEESWKMENYGRYGGVDGGGNSFEEMLINAASEVKKIFGDYQMYHSFYTEDELINQKTVEPMFSVPCVDRVGYSQIIFNDKYVHVNDGLINLRWLKWFMGTEYAKKNWDFSYTEWNGYIDKLNNEPEKRKELLRKCKLDNAI